MYKKDSPQSVIDSYRRRQQLVPFLIGGFAVLLVAVGIIILVVWLTNQGGGISLSFLHTATPTPTITSTPTQVPPTATITLTPTETTIPTETVTPTISGPFEYTVQEGDSCWSIAEKFGVDFMVLMALNNFNNDCPVQVGNKILIPAPDMELPTRTPIPMDLIPGTEIDYTIQSGDTLESIASDTNSTVEDIMTRNDIENGSDIDAGQTIKVRVNLVTPTPTLAFTSTSAPTSEATTAP